MQLTTFDFILIFAYFAILLLVGYFSSKKQNEEDFLIAKRELGSLSTMATLNASKTGSILMIFVAMVYLWGFSAIWYFIGAGTGLLVFLPFALKLKEKSKTYYTLADYFKHNYGKTVAIFASLLGIFLMFGYMVLCLIAGAKIFMFFTSWPFWICAIIMVSIVLAYLLMGGFKAVVKTDIVQYIAIVGLFLLLTIMIFDSSTIPVTEWDLFGVDTLTLIGFFIAGIISPFALPDLWQRVYASKNKKTLKRGFLLSVVFYLFVAFLLGLVAITTKINFPGIDPDLALIHGFANLLPPGLVGLSVVLLFSALMSSLDTQIFTASSSIVQDFFKWDKKKTVKSIKKVIFFLAIIGTGTAILLPSLVSATYIFASSFLILGMISLSTWIKRDIKSQTLIYGFTFGIIFVILYLIYSFTLGEITSIMAMVGLGGTLIGLLVGGIIFIIRSNKKIHFKQAGKSPASL